MLAWTAALVDENLADVEKSRLSEYAQAFGIEKEREEELKKLAQHYIIENAAAAGSLETNENLTQLADKIGITHEDAERALISYKKRS
jgi:DNA-binding phage protein